MTQRHENANPLRKRPSPEAWLEGWRSERPDVDLQFFAIFGRIIRLSCGFDRFRAPVLRELGVTPEISDLIISLLRSGEPYELNCRELAEQATFPVTTSGAMTHRIDCAEALGLVERRRDLRDRRAVLVGLTKKGLRAANLNVDLHIRFLREILGDFSATERTQLAAILKKLLTGFAKHRSNTQRGGR